MPCIVSGQDLILAGDVGSTGGWWSEEEPGFTSNDVAAALAQIGNSNPVRVLLNSGGGIVWDGSAIHAILSRHPGKVTVVIQGVAASSASVIAMAGDEIEMSLGSVMMVHNPATITIGTAEEHRVQISQLDAVAASMASIYAAKTGQSIEQCRADMNAETWMTADEAIAKGYADRVEGTADAEAASTAPIEPAPFAYRAYRHAPEPILALADRKNWPRRLPVAAAQSTPKAQETVEMPTEDEIQARIDAAVKRARDDDKTAADKAVEDAASALAASHAAQAADTTAASDRYSRADAAEIAEICANGGAPSMTATLIREGVTAAAARERVNAAGQIKDVVALASKNAPHLAADFADRAIAAGKSVATVKAELFDAMAARSEAPEAEVDHHKRAGAGGANHSATTPTDARAKSKASMQAELKRRGMLPKEG